LCLTAEISPFSTKPAALGRLGAVTRQRQRKSRSQNSVAPTIVDVTISGLDHDGRGTGIAGDPVAIPFTMPGDHVRARIWNRGPDGLGADLLEILTPSADRVPAPCPLYGVCGGCQLQHLSYPRQLGWKTSVVRDLVEPLGLADKVASCVASPRTFGYRSKITPHHDYPRAGQPLAIGFLRVGRRHDVVDVERCPLATDGINAALPRLRADIAAAATARSKGASFLVREAASGVTTDPDARVTERVGGLELEFFAREFFQNNPFLLPALVTFVVDAAASGGARALVDAYSGSGLFALSAAARFSNVMGVEISPGAVAAARENAARNNITNARFVAADAIRIFVGIDGPGADAAVIIDPPRKGCGPEFLAQLIEFGPRTIVYVSCNPETMARDLQVLMRVGYAVSVLQPFDMFPQTRHVECVAVLKGPVDR
jgi:tRNA/tmRNA/rRNA uracil-C5-methylase (TrmA/RlmC/RlmD family)